ncbi:hypothetical protein J8I26_01080 [Herbaspirillum sp. LeCh32-8]|uniref:cytochrome oxidase putative small subunit CydP n=1 Tax=Herbaspirillum sp. LeCh32-8 TaxID=2821356 RepID=UPI001AEA6735|nr:cytochrome oxidase putative small subunit CydP [Herbaspirillum sp. LeCh32-8]MBP0596682.1 hypothetical protein [Herbaspirillum sp. LeCh32-8]
MRFPGKLPRLTQLPLGVEITLLLIVKVALLTVLAKTFFAHPQAKHMRMPTESVELRMLSPGPAPAGTTRQPYQPPATPDLSDAPHTPE